MPPGAGAGDPNKPPLAGAPKGAGAVDPNKPPLGAGAPNKPPLGAGAPNKPPLGAPDEGCGEENEKPVAGAGVVAAVVPKAEAGAVPMVCTVFVPQVTMIEGCYFVIGI
jgi:hypothetical protein